MIAIDKDDRHHTRFLHRQSVSYTSGLKKIRNENCILNYIHGLFLESSSGENSRKR